MSTVRVATFNIRNGRAFDGLRSWPFRARDVATAIASLDAPIVGLQEAYRFQVRSIVRRLGDVRAVGDGRSARRRGEHVPLLVRDGIRVVDARTRWYGAASERPGSRLPGAHFPRIATITVLEVDGTRIQIVNTHLDSASAEHRATSVAQLVTWLDPELPRVVLGDLNAEPDGPELAPLHEAGLRQALPADAGGTNHDFSGRTDGRRLDHILVSAELEVLDAEIAHPRPRGRLASDHWPVAATLRVKA